MKSHHRQALLDALAPLANIPQWAQSQTNPDLPIVQWNNHRIYPRDVMAAREAIQAIEADMPEIYGMTITQKEKTA